MADKPLASVKSLLLTFEGNGVHSSVTVNRENYKNINSLVEAETGTKDNKLVSCIEGDQAYDWSDCLFEGKDRLDSKFLEAIFTDADLDSKLNLLILEGFELTQENLDEIKTFNPKTEKLSFPEFILSELNHNVEVKDSKGWHKNPTRLTKMEAKDFVARLEANGFEARATEIKESLSLKEADDLVEKMYEDHELTGMTATSGNILYAYLETVEK